MRAPFSGWRRMRYDRTIRTSTSAISPASASTRMPGMTSITRSAARLIEASPVTGSSLVLDFVAAAALWRARLWAARDAGVEAGAATVGVAGCGVLLVPCERALAATVAPPARRRAPADAVLRLVELRWRATVRVVRPVWVVVGCVVGVGAEVASFLTVPWFTGVCALGLGVFSDPFPVCF